MKRKEFLKLITSKCYKDYRHHHYWVKVGVDKECIIWQCSQCEKCLAEKITFLKRRKR